MQNITSPRTDDQGIEQEILAKGLTAPSVTPTDLASNIQSVVYFTAADGVDGAALQGIRSEDPSIEVSTVPLSEDNSKIGTAMEPLSLLTFCVITLQNGFTVTGESACASPENFNAEIGRKIAYENAKQKI